MHTGAVELGGMNVGDQGDTIMFFGKNAGFVGEPVVGVNDVGFEVHKMFLDKINVAMLDVTDGEIMLMSIGRDDFGINV